MLVVKDIQRSKSNLSHSIKQDMPMTEDKVWETAALHKFRQKYRKSDVIFEEGSIGSEMYLIHTLVTGQRLRIKRSSRLSKRSPFLL
jgi:hypothetical protein